MFFKKNKKITVRETVVSITDMGGEEYISLKIL